MEIDKLISALEETVAFLQNSKSSVWASRSVDEIVQELEAEISTCRNSRRYDSDRLAFLFAPTGAIQETAIDNGWGIEYLRISEVIDQFTAHP